MKRCPIFTARTPRAGRLRLLWPWVCLSLLMLALPALSITLASNGTTQYVIAKKTGCSTDESTAATDLQTYLHTMSNVTIPINSYADISTVPTKAIVIGSLTTSPTLALEQVEMKVDGERLILRGGGVTLAHRYAVFTFLEDYFGCRYFSPTVEYVPTMSTVTVADDYNVTQSPSFAYRYLYHQDATFNPTWCVKNRVNGAVTIDGTHNLYSAVPPTTYFATHPEYYPYNNGQRMANTTTQWLCFTNPDLPQIIANYAMGRMAATNANTLVSVAQGDDWAHCDCDPCKAALAQETGQSGVMLRCLNQVADIVAQSYPNRRLITFAYMHTEAASITAPRSNLMIRLCHWRRCDLHALDVCSKQNPFEANLAMWQYKTTPDQLYIWHYATSFQSQAAPWPNVRGIIPTIKYYYDHDVRGIYEQIVGWGRGCDLGWLKPYLMAKALWNKDVNADTVYNDYMNGYYGPAADEMDAYIDLLEDQVATWHPDGIVTSVDLIKGMVLPSFTQADALYDAAEAAAAAYSQELYDRVHYDRYSLLFMHTYRKLQLERISSPADRLVKLGDNRYYDWKNEFWTVRNGRGCGIESRCDAASVDLWKRSQGGDITTLENNKVKIAICPWLNGAIVSLIDKRTGLELLHPARMSDNDDAYPYNGWYNEAQWSDNPSMYAQTAAASSSVTTDGNGNQILTVVTDYGVGAWDPSFYMHRITSVITLPPGDATSLTMHSKVKNLHPTWNLYNEKTEGRLALETFTNYSAVTATMNDDSTATVTAFPTTYNSVKQVDFDNGKHGVRLSIAFDPTMPSTSLTVSDSPTSTPNTLFSTFYSGLHSYTPNEEEDVLKQTWTLTEIPIVPVAQNVIWTDFRNTSASYGSGSTIKKDTGGNSTFNADAISTKRIVGDGYLEYRLCFLAAPTVMGLNITNSDASNNDIDYGIETYYTAPNTYCVARENGTRMGTPQLMGSQNDVLRVERVGTTVYYKRNGVTFYTSTVPSSGPLMADCSLLFEGHYLRSCRLCADAYYEPPIVTLTGPAEGAIYAPGDTITLTADAQITDGSSTVSTVEFFQGTTKLGEDSTSPYSFDWTSVPSGTKSLTAKATTNNSLAATSTAVNVRVNTLPTVSITDPAENVVYPTAPPVIVIQATAADTDGTVTKVEFYENGSYLGEDADAPYTHDWFTPAAGPHTLTTVAIDSDVGETVSVPVQVNVEVIPPTVSLTSPTHKDFIIGNSVTITANASDSDGTISKVEFYEGTAKLGEDTSSPYSFNWTDVSASSHTLLVKAIDDDGCITTSDGATITVMYTQDIGSVGATGSASYNSGTFTVSGAGAGITGTADAFRFVYTQISGNCTIIARIATCTTTASTARVGVMVRQSLDANAKLAAPLFLKYNNRVYRTYRLSTGGTAGSNSVTAGALPYWVKIVRSGGTFTLYISPDGVTWTQAGDAFNNSMTNPVYIGLVVSSGTSGTLKTATFDNVLIKGANVGPVTSITSPANDHRYPSVPANITINANASDLDGTVSKVEFYDGTTKLGEDTSSPYSYDWTNVPDGIYSLTVKATDNDTAVTTSSPAKMVNVGPNHLPTVSITYPADDAVFNNNVIITADAADEDGNISKVEFYQGANKIGEDLTSPYAFEWTDVAAGTYTLTAKAIDRESGSTVSAGVDVRANAQPTVSITAPEEDEAFNGAISITADASDTDGSISKVEFYEDGLFLGEDTASPYTYEWASPPIGVHAFTARAVDSDEGDTTSAAVNARENNPPTVSLTAPADYQRYTTVPASVTLTADASDSDGTISKVEFYQGTTKVGEDSVAPYSYNWTGVPEGDYLLTAKAIDSDGGNTDSAPAIHIHVGPNVLPTVSLTSPTDGAAIIGNSLTLTADASDTDGTITNVEFYDGTTKIGEDSVSPYSYDWTSVPSGSHSLAAKAIDSDSGETVSSAAAITVWYTQDIGSTGATGSASWSSGTFTVAGAGAGVWNTADAFRFVHIPISGNCTIIARLTSFNGTASMSRAGLMVRETLGAGAKEASNLFYSVSNTVYRTYRTTTGGTTGYNSSPAGAVPYWLKLVRSGNGFSAYKSSDGTNWTYTAGVSISMTDPVYIGLVVTSGASGTLKTAGFSNVSVTSP